MSVGYLTIYSCEAAEAKMKRVLGILALSALVVGCSSQAQPTSSSGVAQGLSIFSSSPDRGLTGMYAEGDLVVFFETARQVVNVPDPELDVSARYTDMEGRNIQVAIGGHLQPDAWSDDFAAITPEALHQHQAAIPLVKKAAAALSAASIDAQMAPEQTLLTSMIGGLAPQHMSATRAQMSAFVGHDAETLYATGVYWIRWLGVYYGSFSDLPIAQHSSVEWQNDTWDDSSNQWVYYNSWGVNNHGRYPWDSGMSFKCGRWQNNYDTAGATNNLQLCDSLPNGSGYMACNAFWTDGHNCHDDTTVEMYNILGNTWYSSAPGTCHHSWGCQIYAPNCI
jgi:hypothetical protein